MASPRNLPFQVVMTLRVAVIVLVLTATFLWIVLGRVEKRIEEAGLENFDLLARGAFSELDAITNSFVRYLETLVEFLSALPDSHAAAAADALARSLLVQPGPNAVAVAWPNDDLVYVLKRDGEAPVHSTYTIGRYARPVAGPGTLDVSYHEPNGTPIGRQQRSAVPLYPTKWPWYGGAMQWGRYASEIYSFPGDQLGFTLAARLPFGVVSLSTPVELLDQLLGRVSVSANGAALLLDDKQRVVALRVRGVHWGPLTPEGSRLQSVRALAHPILGAIPGAIDRLPENESGAVRLAGQPFLAAWHTMIALPGTQYRLLLLAPLADMARAGEGARRDVWLVALASLAVLLPLTWWGAGGPARVLRRLVQDSRRIERLDFAPAAPPIPSGVYEVEALIHAHEAMRASLAERARALERVSGQLKRLIDIGIRLVDQKDQQALLDAVLRTAHELTGAHSSVLNVRDEADLLRPVAMIGFAQLHDVPTLDLQRPDLKQTSLAVYTVLTGTTSVVDDFVTDAREELTTWRRYGRDIGFMPRSIVSLPLRTPDNRVMGVMQIFNATDPDTGKVVPFSRAQVSYLEALAAQAAVALENQKLIASQRQLLDTLVRTLGDAVDAKSAHTGRHCARVPELALMLAREAHDSSSGPLADFAFRNEDEWQEFRIGAWLHDCGKITSPEHVIDKATKLETAYNRLHEIRMRFEVLLRDARIETLEARLAGVMDADTAQEVLTRHTQRLRDDYAFIAASNQGSEKMEQDDIARVRMIARQTWLRHFDDRLGLSEEEMAARANTSASPTPATEQLIADKPWHLVPRPLDQTRALTEGFRMRVPEHLYHRGELYNLCIERGTLTPEERFKVNEHIIHTIRMLEGAQFPAHLRRVPEYAGTHHESLDGSGYPRGLGAAELSVPARIMAIADIFEALTAADRPYKRAKTLSESITILHQLKRKGRIDGDLFELFLRTGVHLRYAERFLSPEQIDTVDIQEWLH